MTVDQARSVTATFTRGQSGGGGGGGGGLFVAPMVAQSCQASALSSSGATLSASVDPNGLPSSTHFDYGTTAAYGSQTSEQSVGSDYQNDQISAMVGGLQAGTTYQCRVVATSLAGTTYGADQTFRIQPAVVALAPTVQQSCQLASVTASGASVSGSVNPNGQATSVYFQYGTSANYGSQTPTQPLGSDSQGHQVSAMLSGLAASTTYHCRVGASNQAGATYGADETFTTQPQSGGGGHSSRGRAGLRLDSIFARAARRGCMVEYSRLARDAQLSDRDCTAAMLTLIGSVATLTAVALAIAHLFDHEDLAVCQASGSGMCTGTNADVGQIELEGALGGTVGAVLALARSRARLVRLACRWSNRCCESRQRR